MFVENILLFFSLTPPLFYSPLCWFGNNSEGWAYIVNYVFESTNCLENYVDVFAITPTQGRNLHIIHMWIRCT